MTWVFIFRLVVAGLLGTVVGIEREWRVKEAGFRTHFLVSLGSALFMIVSQWGFEEFLAGSLGVVEGPLDAAREFTQVVRRDARCHADGSRRKWLPASVSSEPARSSSTARSCAA